jgi:NCS1 family nucleobase:cation symporter-1
VLADYLLLKGTRLDVPALFDPRGAYRYVRGVNVAAVVAIAAGVGAYYVVPDSWVKVLWGTGVGAAAYLGLVRVQQAALPPARGAVPQTGSL